MYATRATHHVAHAATVQVMAAAVAVAVKTKAKTRAKRNPLLHAASALLAIKSRAKLSQHVSNVSQRLVQTPTAPRTSSATTT